MSHLSRRLPPLASLERDREPPKVKRAAVRLHQPTPASAADPDEADSHNPDDCLPLYGFLPYVWKYDVDEQSPWWKKIFFRYAWLPFARFSYFKMGIIPFQRLQPDGTLEWKEQQGIFIKEEDAEREAAKHAYGGYDKVALNASEAAITIINRSHFPASDAWLQYERHAAQAGTREETIAQRTLQTALNESQKVIDRWRTQKHA